MENKVSKTELTHKPLKFHCWRSSIQLEYTPLTVNQLCQSPEQKHGESLMPLHIYLYKNGSKNTGLT